MMKRAIFPLLILLCLFQVSPAQIFTDSNLPIVVINTDGGAEIPDDPRILGTMKIIYRGEGQRNYLSDINTPEYLNYDGRINIEIRGSSSQAFEKKQYGFSTKQTDGITNNNVSLLGMPADNDWILNNNIFDPSMIRNYLSYNLSRMIGEYSSRTVFCEVVINSSYQGLYLMLEKIKQAPARVNILEMKQTDSDYPDITGGYITKSDKTTGGDPVAWYMSSYNWTNDIQFIHDSPEPYEITSAQNQFIHNEFLKLSSTVTARNSSPLTGYPSVIDIPSFVDYMLLNELAANADGYQLSTFYHKDRNGKLRAGPLWDMDLTYGNDLFLWGYDRSKTDVWQFANGENDGPRYWKDLFYNNVFGCYFSRRWHELTQAGQPMNYQSLATFIDQTVALIGEAVVRENNRWGTVGNHANKIAGLKSFLQERITWITNNIGSYWECLHPELPSLVITKIMYAPDTTATFPVSNDQEFIEITNTGNEEADLTGIYFSGTGFVYKFLPNTSIEAGESKIIAGNSEVFLTRYGFYPAGQFTRSLSNSGERLVLADCYGNPIDIVEYSSLSPWPDASFNGYYIELADNSSDNNIGTNWVASSSQIVTAEDLPAEPVVELYPSPVRDILRIVSEDAILNVQFFDLTGTVLNSETTNTVSYSLNMTSLSPGLYLVKVTTVQGSVIRKIIKQ